jgi:hypothetical protein
LLKRIQPKHTSLSVGPVTQQNVIVTNPDGLSGSNPSMTLEIEVGAEYKLFYRVGGCIFQLLISVASIEMRKKRTALHAQEGDTLRVTDIARFKSIPI